LPQTTLPHQLDASVNKNIAFFHGEHQAYTEQVHALDTYAAIRTSTDNALAGITHLLDIGNGGVFNYDVTLVSRITTLDLFSDVPSSQIMPPHIVAKQGSALDIPAPNDSFDGVLMAMLLHHLVGHSTDESVANLRRSISEAWRVLQPGGKLVIVESCVAPWFYLFECMVFVPAQALINRFLPHPATLQYPPQLIGAILQEYSPKVDITRIPKGRWILQFGFQFPAALTPATPYCFVAHKPAH